MKSTHGKKKCESCPYNAENKSALKEHQQAEHGIANTGENLTASSLSTSWLKLNALTSPIHVLKSELLHILASYHIDCRRKTEGKLSLGLGPDEIKMERK